MSADDTDDAPPEQTVHVADDLKEYLQRQRYDDIFQAKRSAAKALRDVPAALGPGPNDAIADIQGRERVSAAVTGFLIEIRRLFKESEQGRELWGSQHFGDFSIKEIAPVSRDDFDNLTVINGLSPVERNGTYIFEINGVSDYKDLADTVVVVEWSEVSNPATGRVETNYERLTPYPPIYLSRDVFEQASEQLGDMGLDVDLQPDSDEASWGPDYRQSDDE